MDNELWRWIWTFAAVGFTIGEAVTAGFFMLPFGIGAALAAVAAWIGLDGWLQWVLFFAGSAASMVVIRKFMRGQDTEGRPVGVNRYVGATGRVLQAIDPDQNTGMIRVETEEWRATTNGAVIEEGSDVTIVAMQGTRLLVEPVTASSTEPNSGTGAGA